VNVTLRHPPEQPGLIGPKTTAPGKAVPARRTAWQRWLPFASGTLVVTVVLLAADTPALDLARFAAYATLAVIVPGTLVYRALRRRPHTLVEDLAMGAAVGLTLELAALAVFSVLDWRAWVWLWPLAVIAPFAMVPRLRRHWWVRGYTPTPLAWSWAVAGVVTFFMGYLSAVFLQRNPILPPDEDTRQYLDLPYHLSLAGELTHRFPPNLPQVAGEPLHYHWFGHAHMAMTAMVGHIDLPVVALRLAVPGLSVLAIVLSAVVGWRISGRPYVGAITAVLFWVIGEVHFAHPTPYTFGSQVTFVVWHGMSMVYSWVLLLALIVVLADVIGRSVAVSPGGTAVAQSGGDVAPELGPGAYALVALLAFASSGAKATTLPVVLAALALAAVILLVRHHRLPGPVIAAVAIVAVAQLFAVAVLFRFQTYGLRVSAFAGLAFHWVSSRQPLPGWLQGLLIAGTWIAFLINMQSRLAGIVPLVWLRRGHLSPVQWFLLGGALAGPVLNINLRGADAVYFTRTGFTFGVILSAWGYTLMCERARLPHRATVALGLGAAFFALALVTAQILLAGAVTPGPGWRILPVLKWSAVLVLAGVAGALAWRASRARWPALHGRGAPVALTVILVAGAPGLVMDAYQAVKSPNGYFSTVVLPRSRIEAARWVREHSRPADVLATNVHCREEAGPTCDPRSFWLSAYAERSVLVEGWGFASRLGRRRASARRLPFWDHALLRLNDEAFTAPTPGNLRELSRGHGVRWLVVDRTVVHESPVLRGLATRRFDNGRMAVYELRPD
jgi:hypothetical protein